VNSGIANVSRKRFPCAQLKDYRRKVAGRLPSPCEVLRPQAEGHESRSIATLAKQRYLLRSEGRSSPSLPVQAALARS